MEVFNFFKVAKELVGLANAVRGYNRPSLDRFQSVYQPLFCKMRDINTDYLKFLADANDALQSKRSNMWSEAARVEQVISQVDIHSRENWGFRVEVRASAAKLFAIAKTQCEREFLVAVISYFVEPERMSEAGESYFHQTNSLIKAPEHNYCTPSRLIVGYSRNALETPGGAQPIISANEDLINALKQCWSLVCSKYSALEVEVHHYK